MKKEKNSEEEKRVKKVREEFEVFKIKTFKVNVKFHDG